MWPHWPASGPVPGRLSLQLVVARQFIRPKSRPARQVAQAAMRRRPMVGWLGTWVASIQFVMCCAPHRREAPHCRGRWERQRQASSGRLSAALWDCEELGAERRLSQCCASASIWLAGTRTVARPGGGWCCMSRCAEAAFGLCCPLAQLYASRILTKRMNLF